MAGFNEVLAQGGEQAQAGPPPAQGMGDAVQDDRQPASPEMQKQYNQFVAMSLLMLYDEKFMKTAEEIFKKGVNVTESMARVATGIAMQIVSGAKNQGQDVPPEILLNGGWELMNEVRTFAQAATEKEISDDDMETAFYLAADMLRAAMQGAGMVDQETMKGEYERISQKIGPDAFDALVQRLRGVHEQTAAALDPTKRQQGGQGQPMPQQQQEMAQ